MAIKKYKPRSPGFRHRSVVDYSCITVKEPYKPLTRSLKNRSGRNSYGRITVRRRGGGNKKLYRIVDFKRIKQGIPAKILTIEYDPNRSAFISLIGYADGKKCYIIYPKGCKVGDTIGNGENFDNVVGVSKKLKNIPAGTIVHNIELVPGKGAQLVRSAGVGAKLMSKDIGTVLLKLPSGEQRIVRDECLATIGQVGNEHKFNTSKGKAGASRWIRRRPKVRGVVMNPVDHPHGGGEGKTSGGRHPVSFSGIPTKGFRTRNPRKKSSRYIVRRRYDK